ncbi:YeeE/YedE family protein [Variovorax sp. HJSM1_2]|uniref:YeeE/YedE family protein n=1 Tax=Variovorax sp. HJSM1_2 TaxID=3366263 RepID=UPI003BD5D0B1
MSLSLCLGFLFGAVLQRSRFCFYCVSRDFIASRDARGLLGVLAALALGTLGYHLVFGVFLSQPIAPRLPPGAHIGPVSWVLAVGALVFGVGMALAGSCISAQFYRLGEGLLSAPLALIGTALGFVLGFWCWNTLYLGTVQEAPIVWLPHHLGYGGSIAVQLAALAGLGLLLWRWHRTPAAATSPSTAWWRLRWPTYVGGLLVAAIGVGAYLRIAPLGVTAELGSVARTLANQAGVLPARLEGLDSLRGCATVLKVALWSNNGIFVVALVLGAFAAALSGGDFKLRVPTWREAARSFGGGVLMGWGAMVALGCTVGTLLSGIMAASLSGWLFALFCGLGLWAGWWLRHRAPYFSSTIS